MSLLRKLKTQLKECLEFCINLVKLKEFSKGKKLAEEFEDYQILIEICDELKDIEQLRIYIEQYEEKVEIFIWIIEYRLEIYLSKF
mgnify:CR=1 FL=1